MLNDVLTFTDSTEAYGTARRKAVHGHRDWLVWKLPDGSYRVAKLGPDVLEAAMRDCAENDKGKPIVTQVAANSGHYYHVSRGLAEVYLGNMRAGHFVYG